MRRPLFLLLVLLTPVYLFSQHFRKGYDITYNATGTIPSRDLNFGNFPTMINDYFTGGTTSCSGGMKHITKTKAGGMSQSMLNLDNGQPLDIDFEKYPYATIRVKSTANTDITMSMTARGNPSRVKTFIIKGSGTWNTIRLDFSDQMGDPSGSFQEIHWGWTEPIGTTYPYDLYFDYIRLGGIDDKGTGATLNTGDPDSTVQVGMSLMGEQVCEKEGGQQIIYLSGITNGKNITNLTLSQTNTKPTLFSNVTFDAIMPDGTCQMHYTPQPGMIGKSTAHLLLIYNQADTIIKYKSVYFDINVITNPSAKAPVSIVAQVNQPKVALKLTSITSCIGSASNLALTVSCKHPALITNLKADTVKSDGTSTISFIPGVDLCGQDSLTITLTDKKFSRSTQYKIPVEIIDPVGNCCGLPSPIVQHDTICPGDKAVLKARNGIGYRWYAFSSGGTILSTDSNFVTPALSVSSSYYVASYDGFCESPRKPVTAFNFSSEAHINYLINDHILCNSAPEKLYAEPLGGTFSGDGVKDGYFIPALAKINQINMIYYTVNEYSCQVKDSVATFVFSCVGLNDDSLDDFKIYPNPAVDKTIVEFKGDEEFLFQIIDMNGHLIQENKKNKTDSFEEEIDLKNVPAGVYVVRIISADKIITTKLTVQK